ncbi:hypothetical protein B0F90DRAFT_1682491 [Multifurca ochricompacta]|uniref:F-box domain-containing protein n=1 Tax=Multifurca ochricompacta TaxID=376703 RepID=A0AAD4QS42_9AGAM|nr:hypothetical protein B0F90DRAFT_1682491 [Multifurca ochricompacta]
MGTQLLRLPDEVLVLIISFLPLRDITACKRSCWQLRAVIKQSGILRCRIRTLKNHLEDISPPGLSSSDFLKSLKRWEKAWLTFDIGKDTASYTTHRPYYEGYSEFLLQSGYLIAMPKGERRGWSYLDLYSQRGHHKDQLAPKWTGIQLAVDFRIRGWALDVDQDLVAVSFLTLPHEARKGRMEIRLMHFTTGVDHQSTSAPAIQLEFEGKYDMSFRTQMEVLGDNLVVLIAHESSFLRRYQTLYLVDWVRGRVLCSRRAKAGTYFPVLTSISKDVLVLGRKRDWALELCKIERNGRLDTFTLCTLCVLKLPAVRRGTYTELTGFRRAPSGTPRSLAVPRPSALPFRSSPADTVLSFYVVVIRREKYFSDSQGFFFYVLPNALRALADVIMRYRPRREVGNKETRSAMSSWLHRYIGRAPLGPPAIVSWEDWGPRSTRWVTPDIGLGRQSLCGMRCAFMEVGGSALRMLDFNPGRLRRVVAVRDNGKDGEKTLVRLAVTTPSTIPAGHFFLHDITSSLPYYELKRTGLKSDFFLMDDEWTAQIEDDDIFGDKYIIMVHSVFGSNS